ncbi:type II toxin-antitoxin system antitoxin SocA domain-containing protein [Enterococcus gilvus]|uniref:Panacea domain-containing protein n=1 Tax=Enterococcus gilvus TaxID=160453 RepID=UPI00290BA8F5|nr:type II toxin-antitoxin system antitoxin SocA domain-containing protein [Enterococcus gilvus]MDU5511626.1 DUF4065 domain-containing protein [Enterococcus gilvus]
MLKAMDVADFILQNRIDAGNPISNLELQKYLYFVNAKFLVEEGKTLFEEPIEKWKFGPVVNDVYHEYKDNRASKITGLSKHENIEITDDGFKIVSNEFKKSSIPKAIRTSLEESIDKLSKYDPFKLVEETHKHSEWKNDEESIMNGASHLIYNNDSMREYFIEHEEARIW